MARRRGVLALTLGAGAASAQNITYYDLTYAYSGMGPWSGCVSSSPPLFMMVDQTPDIVCASNERFGCVTLGMKRCSSSRPSQAS